MKFVNKGEGTQVRIEVDGEYQWILLWPGEEVDIPEQQGINYGFEKIKAIEGKIGNVKVETKVKDENEPISSQAKDSEAFLKELEEIKGIGFKTAKEIVKKYSKEELIDALKNNYNQLLKEFRDDIVKKLEEKYANA